MMASSRSSAMARGVVDVRGEPADAVALPGVIAAAATRGGLVSLDATGVVARWERSGERWRCAARVALPAVPQRPKLAASPSGRCAFVDGARGLLVDLDAGRTVTELDADYGTARPCFDVLPDGREVLFVAAPGYMSVRMLEATTGRALASFRQQTSYDFCHVDFRLALDGTRLVTFGCVWAGPYEARIYDATPWTCADGAAAPPPVGFPAPAHPHAPAARFEHAADVSPRPRPAANSPARVSRTAPTFAPMTRVACRTRSSSCWPRSRRWPRSSTP
jgi:hypothetical protein